MHQGQQPSRKWEFLWQESRPYQRPQQMEPGQPNSSIPLDIIFMALFLKVGIQWKTAYYLLMHNQINTVCFYMITEKNIRGKYWRAECSFPRQLAWSGSFLSAGSQTSSCRKWPFPIWRLIWIDYSRCGEQKYKCSFLADY